MQTVLLIKMWAEYEATEAVSDLEVVLQMPGF